MTSHAIRLHLPVFVLALGPVLLALRFGGYHVRTGGWIVLALLVWACVQAARGRLAAPRSIGGVATFALVALAGWSCASISWADVSTHEAWVETVRAAGYAAAFVVAGSILANARAYTRFVQLAGGAIGLLGVATLVRMGFGDEPLRAFVAGRIDWPVGYAPGLAALHLLGMLLLLGASCGAERAWQRTRDTRDLAIGAATFGLACGCMSLAALAQSRGTLPALAVGIIVLLVATPQRTGVLLRLAVMGTALLAARATLGDVFQTQFAYRQAPFTEGANADALLTSAVDAAHAAGRISLVLVVVGVVAGAALLPLSAWLSARVDELQERAGFGFAIPATVLVVALVGALAVLGVGGRSPVGWAQDQWRACVDPPVMVNDPGSATSYFSNTGTGRCDYYRVALQTARDQPLTGTGAGNFRGAYVLERTTVEEPRTAHSLPLQLLGELGIVGALLGAITVGCVVLAAWRFVASGPARDPAFAGAIAAIAYWLAHAAIDWLWQLPAVSLPAILLAGGLAACVSPAQARVRASVAAPFAAAGILASLALVLPPTMADRALRQARDPELRREDPTAALEAVEQAQSFDPAWGEPYITEGSIRTQLGQRAKAAAAGRAAVDAEPDNWSIQYRASGLIGLEDSVAGRRAYLAARRLNPMLERTERLRRPPAGADSLQDPDA